MSDGATLCVMNGSALTIDNPLLLAAQSFAIEHSSPLCAVYCVADDGNTRSSIAKLTAFERLLSTCNIPLLVMIGDVHTRVKAAAGHYRARAIFDHTSTVDTTHKELQRHPHSWPGSFSTTTELLDMPSFTC